MGDGIGRYVAELMARGRVIGLRKRRQRRRRMAAAVVGAAAVGYLVGRR